MELELQKKALLYLGEGVQCINSARTTEDRGGKDGEQVDKTASTLTTLAAGFQR